MASVLDSSKYGFGQMFFAFIVWSLVPLVLVIDNPSLFGFGILYGILMLPFAAINAWRIAGNKDPFKSPLALIFFMLFYSSPLFLIAAYPFTLYRILSVFILFLIGLILPFWNRSITLWLYTLGGRVPLPQKHQWLSGFTNPSAKNRLGYEAWIIKFFGSIFSLGGLIHIIFVDNYFFTTKQSLLIFSFFSLSLIIFCGLTIGADLKRRTLHGIANENGDKGV